jgi:alpha-glucuronidase
MASIGVNGCSINNVNADARVVSQAYLPEVACLAEAMRPWGVRVYISLNFASPREIGGVKTFDPLDPGAVAFWKKTVDAVYSVVPDLGGFVLKADSEGRLGPSEYGRTHADAANAIARALKPHGGLLFYRGFVYNHKMDWRDLKNDRAKAAYDNFHKLDGLFEDNVVIQIKHGPIDFQVREPASPLFGGLERTNQAIELQITQEYLGQQKHLVYVAPMWKEVLDFDMHAAAEGTPVKDLVAGKTFDRPTGGFVGVSNVGRDVNWLGHHLAMANLYAFGRLAWNPDLTSEAIAEEWTRQTFGRDAAVVKTIVGMLMRSWPIYESYTGPLGIGTLTDIIHIHFGPAPESSEYNGWGQWHRANDTGVGMDRSVGAGTRFTSQYRPPVAERFESLATCPDDLLLFFHHVPYTHVLDSGKTVIQHFYDAHYEGAEQAAELVRQWRSLRNEIDEQRFHEVLQRLEFQAGHAVVWRDAICRWFQRRSGIPDRHDRVGNYPNRLEAEQQSLQNYQPFDVVPWEAASGSRAVGLQQDANKGRVSFEHHGSADWFDLNLQYFDENDGGSRFQLYLNEQLLDAWIAAGGSPTPTTSPDSHSSTRRTVHSVALRPGDRLHVEGAADSGERAAVDYLEIVPSSARPRADEPAPRTDENSKKAHKDLLEKARLGATTARIDVYFIGDSITRRWGSSDPQYQELLDNWKKNFFGRNAANFGWGGDTTSNILWRLHNGELEGLRPKAFVILAGTNNLGQSPDDWDACEIARGIKAILEVCQAKVPDARIILMAIFPRNDNRAMLPVIRKTNELIAQYADGERVRFLNINDRLADSDGNLFDGVMTDGLHPTPRGYQIWADALRPLLTELLGPPARVDQAPPPTGDPAAALDR